MQTIYQFTMCRYELHILTFGELANGLFFHWFCLETEGKTYEKLRNILRSSTQICHSHSLRIPCCCQKFPVELGKFPEISPIFHGKAIPLSFLEHVECVGTLANFGGRYSIYVSDVRCIVAPSPVIYGPTMRSRWPTRRRKWQPCFEQ